MTLTAVVADTAGEQRPVRLVIVGAALGTIFEWYDFFLYLSLSVFFGKLFFPLANPTAGLLASLATFGVAFVVRPFGSLLFGHIGDLVGRKYSFLITITMMGLGTAAIGFLPTYETIGWAAPVLLVVLRLVQGLSLGGEFSGAATYVAEHAEDRRRGYLTSYVQMTIFIGTGMSMLVVLLCRLALTPDDFARWGWRIPFLLSLLLLAISIYIRLKLQESPVFAEMKQARRESKAPLREAFTSLANLKVVVITLVMCLGQVVVGYMSAFTYIFLLVFLKVDFVVAALLSVLASFLTLPVFILGGWLSDRIGRKWIMLGGCLLASLTFFPIFHGIAHYANPGLVAFDARFPITVASSDCHTHLFVTPNTKLGECDEVREFLTSRSIAFTPLPGNGVDGVTTTIGAHELKGFDAHQYLSALVDAGYPPVANRAEINAPMLELLLILTCCYAALTFGPLAAFLVENFPTRIRYTSVSVAYNFGGMVGGLTPFFISALSVRAGDIYFGLWFPVLVSAAVFVFGAFTIRETAHRRIRDI